MVYFYFWIETIFNKIYTNSLKNFFYNFKQVYNGFFFFFKKKVWDIFLKNPVKYYDTPLSIDGQCSN